MRLGILGKKVGMTQIFNEAGASIPVTVVDTAGCHITQVKTRSTDGYDALQMGIGSRKPQNVNKAGQGHFKKAGVAARASTQEVRFKGEKEVDLTQLKAGQALNPAMFAKGDKVDVIGISKGHGFTGVMKRLGYKGKHATHGTSKYFRHGGSNGSNTFPGRVLKNKGMPGHDGAVPRTTTNLLVVDVLPAENLILLKGAIPGPKQGVVVIRSSKRTKNPEGRTLTQ